MSTHTLVIGLVRTEKRNSSALLLPIITHYTHVRPVIHLASIIKLSHIIRKAISILLKSPLVGGAMASWCTQSP